MEGVPRGAVLDLCQDDFSFKNGTDETRIKKSAACDKRKTDKDGPAPISDVDHGFTSRTFIFPPRRLGLLKFLGEVFPVLLQDLRIPGDILRQLSLIMSPECFFFFRQISSQR